jgi:putative methyltransferase (TIGR04325 family)
MNSKQYIKKIIRYLLGKKPHSVGVFYNYSDIKKDDFWSSEFWKKQQKDALGLIGDWCFLPELSQTFLSVTVLKLNLLSKDKPISVLDYGGGTGYLYYEMNRVGSLLYPENVRWVVVDEENSLELGRQFKRDDEKIEFFLETPESQKFDVIHISSVLQYIDDVYGFLDTLLEKTNARHIILTRISGGADTPDYFTERKVEGGSHPYHILNLKELTKYMKSKGFQPEFRSSWAKEYIQEIDYDKVPKDYQIYCTSHMFFSTTSKNTKH